MSCQGCTTCRPSPNCPPTGDRAQLPSWLRWLWIALGLVWLVTLLRALLRICRLAGRDKDAPADGTVPPWAYRQPDPMIYSQTFLQAHGVGITWDNPDIVVERAGAPGVPIDKHDLQPDTDYLVISRVWNGSTTAPALGMPVNLSYLDFGIGTTSHEIGSTTVDLSVKGGSRCPAFATIPWRTPPAAGHYCLQTRLLWGDDAEPGNNLGQSNTDVKPLNSPHAAFTVAVRNSTRQRDVLRLTVDSYAIAQRGCDEPADLPSVLVRHAPTAWPVPPGWRVLIEPETLTLAPGEQAPVTVDITAPDDFVGRQVFNVHAFAETGLLGGVTLYVDGSG